MDDQYAINQENYSINIYIFLGFLVLGIVFTIIGCLFFKERMTNFDFHTQIRQNNLTSELVVTYCSEDLYWLDEYAVLFDKITVYNKCNNIIEYTASNIEVINLENIGSCDYAWLNYVINRYDTLPDHIQFTKASKKPYTRLAPYCEKCQPLDQMIGDPQKKHLHNFWKENLREFKLSNWDFSNNPEMKGKFKFVKSGYKNMYDWVSQNSPELNKQMYERAYCNILHGGQWLKGNFTATKEQIRNVPLNTWMKLKNMQKFTNEEVDHFIERTWKPLLCQYDYSTNFEKNINI